MAINLKILGWEAKGLRCPDHSLSFETVKGVYNVALVQMPNGTGKTTVLRLLRAALTGPEVWNDGFEKMVQFRKHDKIEQGAFELKLLHNERRLTIQIQFDFANDEVNYFTTNNSGKEVGFHPPIELKPFLSLEFIKLLVFDGELAAQLLDPRHTNAQKAIEEMYQLSFLVKMKDRVNEYWTEQAQNSGSKGGSKEFTRRKGRVTALQQRYKFVKDSLESDEKKMNELKAKVKKLENDFKQQIEKNDHDALQLREAESDLKLAQQLLGVKTRDLAILMKNPIEFSQKVASSIYSLKESLDRVKLPGIAAREFFEEIADELICICGRQIDADVKEEILKGAKKYLGSEEMNVLNAMKSDIRDKFFDGQVISGQSLSAAIKQVEAQQEREILAQQHLDIVKMDAAGNNPEIQKIQENISDFKKSQGTLEKEMTKYDTLTDSDDSWNLKILARRKARAEEDLADTTDTLELKNKKDILSAILDNAFLKSTSALSKYICTEANKKIKQIMPHNDISIDTIDRSLRLTGKEGGSVGETLSVGYAFLSSLLSNTDQNLPCIVDSPAGPIDFKIRPEIARMVPNLADQFIAFTISSERPNFLEPLIKAVKSAKKDLYFVTLFKKGDAALDSSARKNNKISETDDGISITGKEFFDHFQLETE